MTAPQSPSSPKRDRDRGHRAATDGSPTKRRRQGAGGDGLTTPPPPPSTASSSSSAALAGPSSSSSSPRRRSPRLMQRVADHDVEAGSAGPYSATTSPSRTTAPRRRPVQTQTQASASSSASASTSHSSPIMPLRSRTAPGPRRSAGSLGLESETGCRRPTAAVAPTMRPPPPPRPSTSSGGGGPSDPSPSSPSSLISRRPLGEMTLADADRQARAIRSRHEEVEERREAAAEAAQQQATTMGSSNDPPATPSRTPATGATRRTFSLGRRSTPRRTASSSSSAGAGPSVARRGPLPPTPSVAFAPSSDALNEDTSFSTSSIFDDSLASTTSTSANDAMPSTPRDGQPILGVADVAAAARYQAPSSPSGAPRTPSRRRGQATSGAAGQGQLESPPSDENDDSPGRERRRRREEAAVAAAEKARDEQERDAGGEGEGEDGEPVLLEKGDYREVVAGRAMRAGGRVEMS